MFHWWGDGMWFGGFFWIFIIVLIVWAVSNRRRGFYNWHTDKETAMDILKRRYAKGEISKEQFELMKKDIE